MKKNNFRQELAKFMTEDELSRLKTAFDVIGDIAILEIDEEFEPKEKQIAQTLLDYHKNINTVLKKAGEHSGKFRRQRMKFVAGEDKRLALHKENNSFIYVDVEKSYFSPRLSTERKRIMQKVNEGENILVMFSGVGPYPTVIARNKKPRKILGVEMNPCAHNIALINEKKNKLKNVDFLKGDVNKILPQITKKPQIGLKSNWRPEHLKKRIPFAPELLEIYIGEGDLENYHYEFEKSIEKLSSHGFTLVLHAPLKYKGTEVSVATEVPEINKNTIDCFNYLEKLCKTYNLKGFVGHPYSFTKEERIFNKKRYSQTQKNIYNFFSKHKYMYLYLENIMFGPFSNINSVLKIVKKFSINLCMDIAHLYLASDSLDDFYGAFKKIPPGTYFHIADAKYLGAKEKIAHEIHSFPVGKGEINFDRILPYIKEGIAEVLNTDELNPVEIISSWKELKKVSEEIRKFDRVLMPLPKSAEDFLPVALSSVKRNAVIHFYDFLHEDDFYKAEEKAKRACRKAGFNYKKLDFVKCGQHSPRTFRVCLDFQVS